MPTYQNNKDDKSLCDDIEEINKANKRAASLTRRLLVFSRKQDVQPKKINLNDVITRGA